jgi:hypothetical protein
MSGAEFDESEQPPLPGEPEGWRELQERARSAKDAKELDAIVAEMNRLLDECEKKGANEAPHPAQGRGTEKPLSTSE